MCPPASEFPIQAWRRGWGAELHAWEQQVTEEGTAATLDQIPQITAGEAEL